MKSLSMKSCGVLVIGIGILSLSACSSVVSPPTLYGERHQVSTSDSNRPEWIDNFRKFQKAHADRVYSVGVATKERDYGFARSIASADALKNLARTIKSTVHDLYVEAKTEDKGAASAYTSDMERSIQDGTLQTAKGIISGAEVDKYYWTKYWVQESPGGPVIYYRNVYALVSLSKADFQQAIYMTLNDQEKRVQNPAARHVIHEMKERWLH